jgi:hypothetical protein
MPDHEIVDGSVSGGSNTSHTIVLPALRSLLDVVPSAASFEDYAHAVLVDNVLGKATEGSRRRTFRYLRELYLLRTDAVIGDVPLTFDPCLTPAHQPS